MISDLHRLKELKARIEFLRASVSEAELIHSIEQSLTQFCEFQVTFSHSDKSWEYYILCDVKYPAEPKEVFTDRLDSLYYTISFLVKQEY